MRFLAYHECDQPLQHSGDLSTGAVSAGVQHCVVLAGNNACANRPLHRLGGPVRGLTGILELAQIALGGDVQSQILGVTVQDRGELLPASRYHLGQSPCRYR